MSENAPNKEYIADILTRVERLREQKAELSDAESAVFAEAKAHGYTPKYLRFLLKLRQMSPNEIAEQDAMAAIYRDAAGLGELPLFKQLNALKADTASLSSVIEALKPIVPDTGHIIVEVGGEPIKLFRNPAGEVVQEVYKPPVAGKPESDVSKSPAKRKDMPPPPDVDAEGAEALGKKAYADDVAIVKNPFPAGDQRRVRWDRGWRAASGGDGMGPSKDGGGDDQ